MSPASKAMARALAKDALAAAGIKGPPVDLDDLALNRALRIERHARLAPPLRGAFRPETGLIQVVDMPPRIERFPIAHEIGHAILDESGAQCTLAMIQEPVDAASLQEILEGYNPEATASAIAGQLLVHSPWLREAVMDGRTVDELLEMFDVTRPVLLISIMRDRLLSRVRTS